MIISENFELVSRILLRSMTRLQGTLTMMIMKKTRETVRDLEVNRPKICSQRRCTSVRRESAKTMTKTSRLLPARRDMTGVFI